MLVTALAPKIGYDNASMIAKKYWSKHSVGKKIDFILAPALETMEEFINQDKMFDLIFIDADKKKL